MDVVRLERVGKLKNPVISSGNEHAAFRHVVECLNQLRYRVPRRECNRPTNTTICLEVLMGSSEIAQDVTCFNRDTVQDISDT
jgi:hypothetical protein